MVALEVPLRRQGEAPVGRGLSGGTLKNARERRDACRRQLAAGIDPGQARKAEKLALAGAESFEAIAGE